MKPEAVEVCITTIDDEFLAQILVPGTDQTVGDHARLDIARAHEGPRPHSNCWRYRVSPQSIRRQLGEPDTCRSNAAHKDIVKQVRIPEVRQVKCSTRQAETVVFGVRAVTPGLFERTMEEPISLP